MIYSDLTERHCIAGSLRHPNLLTDHVQYVKEDDFRPGGVNQTIYSVLLDSIAKGEEVSSFRISEKMANAGIQPSDLDVSVGEYLEELKLIQINERSTSEAFRELKKTSVRREFWNVGKALQEDMKKCSDSNIDDIIRSADSIYSQKLSMFEGSVGKVFEDIFEDMEDVIEERGNNPLKEFGMMGPFSRVNEIYGSLLTRGNINLVAARTGQGKTQLGQYYMMNALWKYGIPILHLDMGEMTKFELQIRAATLLTQGKVSPDLLETGEWRKSDEGIKLVRQAWVNIKKANVIGKYQFKDVSEMTPEQIVSVMKRFYLSQIKGRRKPLEDGTEFVTFYDYLKGFDNTNAGNARFRQEHQVMGDFIQKVKSAIKTTVPCPLWTSLQVNRLGISGNKSADAIDDTENVFGLSDRIIQQVSHGWLFRQKTMEEQAQEPNLGNFKFIPCKTRKLGRDREAHVNPVRMQDGTYRKNFIFLEGKNFLWKEIGDLATHAGKIGHFPEDDGGEKDTGNIQVDHDATPDSTNT